LKPSFLYIIALILALASCRPRSTEKPKGEPVARVFDKYLYKEDIAPLVSADMPPEDSARIVQNYISNWVHEMLIVKKAEDNLADDKKNVEKQLQDYRNSLITYAYEQELIRQKLDTVIRDNEIETYYNANKSNFELKDNIIKVRYIKVNKKAPYLDRVRKWYKSDSPKDIQSLQSYCFQFAENFYMDDNTWLLFDDLLKEIPIETYNKELFLQNNRFVEVEDSSSYYFVNIKGFMVKNSASPLGFEKQNIRNIIINKRKLELISKMKNDLFRDAQDKKDFEIYKK
jgi:hypothetical protein